MNKSPKANESFLPVTHRSAGSVGNSNSSSSSGRHGYANGSNSICSMITFFPLQAIQRMLQCFGYSHTIQMQSGRT
jgi:hypothetical protein